MRNQLRKTKTKREMSMIAKYRNHLFINYRSLFLSLVFSPIILFLVNPTLQAQNRLCQFNTLATSAEAVYSDASPGIGDLDKDGIKNLIFCTTVGKVIAVNSLGYEMWEFDSKAQITNPSVVADLKED